MTCETDLISRLGRKIRTLHVFFNAASRSVSDTFRGSLRSPAGRMFATRAIIRQTAKRDPRHNFGEDSVSHFRELFHNELSSGSIHRAE
jgi:hypothetical protein